MRYCIAFSLILSFMFTASANGEIRFGVFAYKGVEETRKQYQPLVDYLNDELDSRVVLEVLSQEEMDAKISQGTLDIATTNPTHFLHIRKQNSLSGALATLISANEEGIPAQKLAGVIIVRSDSPLKTIGDIRGKSIVAPSLKHMGGYRAQVYELHLNGIDISAKTNPMIETRGSHQEVVYNILARKADVGFIRDGILESMIHNGEINASDLRILNEQKIPHYPYRVSTRLYPEWPVFSLPGADPEETKAFLAALLSLKPTHAATLRQGIYGYSLPADYLEVEELARHLRLPPFDKGPQINYQDVWDTYRATILAIGAAVLLIVFFYVYEKRRKNLLESLLANMGDGVYGVDAHGNCIWINDSALSIIGYSRREVLHKDQHKLFHHHRVDNGVYEQEECPIFRTLQDGQKRTLKEHFVRKDGTFVPITLTVAPNRNGGAIVVFSDDSKFDRKEAELEKTNTMLESLLRAIPDLVWMKDTQGVYLTCNKRFEDFFGAPVEEILGKTDYDFISRELADFFREHDRKAMDSVLPLSNFEEISFASDGHYEYVHTTKTAVRDKMGNVIGVMGIGRDFTTFKANEDALKLQKQRLDNIIEGTNAGTWEWHIESGAVVFNERWADIIGYTLEELSPVSIETWGAYTHPEDLKRSEELIERHFSGEIDYYECEVRMKHKNGHWIWVLDRGRVSQWNEERKPLQMSGTHQDITEQKEAEEALRESYERFEKLIRSVPGAIFQYLIRPDGSSAFPMATEQIWDVYEVSPQEVADDASVVFTRIHPEDIEQIRVSIARSAETLEVWEATYRVNLPSRGERWIKGIARPEREQDGSVLWHGYLHDVTDRIRVTEELERARAAAEKANQSKSEFLANMSHEIRTPMNAVLGLSELMLSSDLKPQQHDYLQKIHTSSKLLLGILNDILDYSKIEAGKLQLEEQPFRIDTVLSQLRVLFSEKSTEKGIQLYFHQEEDVPSVILGDSLRLSQVLINLLGNALKFTETGSVTVRIELAGKEGEARAQLRFTIADTGIGMSDEELSLLFAPFTQADSSITRKYGGTGLGLTISKRLVNAMGGEIGVTSQKGTGTTFTFTITAGVENWTQEHPRVEMEHCRALVVDDQEVSRTILETMLRHFGCETACASNGHEALGMILGAERDNRGFDIVLMDWKMPGMDGKEAIGEIRRLEKGGVLKTSVPFIVMQSAHAPEEIQTDEMEIDGFVAKPVTESALFNAINRVKNGVFFQNALAPVAGDIPSLSGIRVLLAEDNELNQEVVISMLQREGVQTRIAHNGQEAVALYLSNPRYFDLILMDVQMPVMGGYEATRLIREHDAKIPIVALTAAAMVEDRDKALAVGMNDHLGKPIEMGRLYATLARWCHRSFEKGEETSAKTDGEPPVLDTDYLMGIVNHDEAGFRRLLHTMLSQLEGSFAPIVDRIRSGDPEARGLIHALKGVSGNIGAKKLAQICHTIDLRYKNNDSASEEEIAELEGAIDALKAAIEPLIATVETDMSEEGPDETEFKALLEEVKRNCEHSAITDHETIKRLNRGLMERIDPDALGEWNNAMENFEFHDVLRMMKGWMI